MQETYCSRQDDVKLERPDRHDYHSMPEILKPSSPCLILMIQCWYIERIYRQG